MRTARYFALWAVFGAAPLLAPSSSLAAGAADLERGEQLVRERRYEEAYALLAPLEGTQRADPTFDYLFGRAALGTHRPQEAKEPLERAVASRPESAEARLALGRAYYALGEYAEAKIKFETVLHLGALPPDLRSQAQTYDASAARYLEDNGRLLGFEYLEAGIGRYHATFPDTTNATFYNFNAGGSLTHPLSGDWSLDATVDYAFRLIDHPEEHNDSDLEWEFGATKSFGASAINFGTRGAASLRSDGNYRVDYGGFADWRQELDNEDEIVAGTYVRRRQYDEGPLRERSRTIAEVSLSWVRAITDSAGLFLRAHGGYQYATERPDGNSGFYGVTAQLDYAFMTTLSGFVFGWWEHDRFNADRIHYHPESLDESQILRRKDDLFEVGGGLAWTFARTWSLRPQVLYMHDDSTVEDFHYRAVEVWVNVRKSFNAGE